MEYRYIRLKAGEKERILSKVKEELGEFGDILFAYVHGGFIEEKFFRDLDIAVWLENPGKAFFYTVDLSAILGAKIGIPVDIQVLNNAPLPFRYWVFTKGVLLFSRNEKLRLNLVNLTIREYIDFKILENTIK